MYYVYMSACVYLCVCMCICACMCIYACVCMYIYVYVYMYMHVYVCVKSIYVCMYMDQMLLQEIGLLVIVFFFFCT